MVLLLSGSLGSYMDKDVCRAEFSCLFFLTLEISFRHLKAVEFIVFYGDGLFFSGVIGIKYLSVTCKLLVAKITLI